MTYSARTRDRYRHALSMLTGLTTAGVLTACGWLAGTAARDFHAEQEAKDAARQEADRVTQADWQQKQAAWRAAQPREVRTVWKRRPVTTVVETRTVFAASTTIGAGGSVSSGSSSGSSGSGSSGSAGSGSSGSSGSGSSGSGSSGGGSNPQPSAPKPPPPPPPAPAPSSGS